MVQDFGLKHACALYNVSKSSYHDIPPCEDVAKSYIYGLGYDSFIRNYKVVRISTLVGYIQRSPISGWKHGNCHIPLGGWVYTEIGELA